MCEHRGQGSALGDKTDNTRPSPKIKKENVDERRCIEMLVNGNHYVFQNKEYQIHISLKQLLSY